MKLIDICGLVLASTILLVGMVTALWVWVQSGGWGDAALIVLSASVGTWAVVRLVDWWFSRGPSVTD